LNLAHRQQWPALRHDATPNAAPNTQRRKNADAERNGYQPNGRWPTDASELGGHPKTLEISLKG